MTIRLRLFILLLSIGICNNFFAQQTTTSSVLDSIYSYIDSVPEIKKIVIKNTSTWKHNSEVINYYEEEYKNMQTHLKYGLLDRYNEQEKINNLTKLINYKLSEEVKQYNRKKLTKDQLKKTFDKLNDSSLYKSINAHLLDSYWGESDQFIILTGQIHNYALSEEEYKIVTITQEQLFDLYSLLKKQKINLLIDEGYMLKEFDKNVPMKSQKSELIKYIDHKIRYDIDSALDMTIYGFEDFNFILRSDSLMKIAAFIDLYSQYDSITFPKTNKQNIIDFNKNIYKILDSFPHFTRNLDTIRLKDFLTEKLFSYDTIYYKNVKTLTEEAYENLFYHTINKRNKLVLSAIETIFKLTNQQIGILRIGYAHLDSRSRDMNKTNFQDKLITIQDYCKAKGLSYIYIEPDAIVKDFVIK